MYIFIARNNPEREVDCCTEQVQDNSIKGSVPVHHGEGKVDQLRQALQQKHTDGEVNFIGGFTLLKGKGAWNTLHGNRLTCLN